MLEVFHFKLLILNISTVFYPLICLAVHYDHMNGYSELVIDRVSKDDSGTYSCVAENSAGTIKSLGFVYVKGKTTQQCKTDLEINT